MPPRNSQRRQQILEALAQMLEANPGDRITTAGLARQVGVSEAALYRHFPSKSKMFEGLIEFIEDTLFSRIKIILNEEPTAALRCEKMLLLLLAFTDRNPGITRILTGDALAGETERLHHRVAQLFDRFERRKCARGCVPSYPCLQRLIYLWPLQRGVYRSMCAAVSSARQRPIGRNSGSY